MRKPSVAWLSGIAGMLVLLTGGVEPFCNRSRCAVLADDAAPEVNPYTPIFGEQPEDIRIHDGLQRRFAQDLTQGSISVSIVLIKGADIALDRDVDSILTLVDSDVINVSASDVQIDEEAWYLAARVSPRGTVVKYMSVVIDFPPLDGAFVRIRDFENVDDSGKPSLALFKLPETIEVQRAIMSSYVPIGYLEI